jgi:hypothetical protein
MALTRIEFLDGRLGIQVLANGIRKFFLKSNTPKGKGLGSIQASRFLV